MRGLLVLVVTSGCGLGWISNQEDRTSGLPTAGAGPYSRLEADDSTPATAPRFHNDGRANVADPSMLAGGAGIRVWFTRSSTDPVISEIHYTEAASAHALPSVGPTLVLEASEIWEEGIVLSPSVTSDPAGGLVMFYEGGVTTPSIGRAVSTDGLTWTRTGTRYRRRIGSSVAFVGRDLAVRGRTSRHLRAVDTAPGSASIRRPSSCRDRSCRMASIARCRAVRSRGNARRWRHAFICGSGTCRRSGRDLDRLRGDVRRDQWLRFGGDSRCSAPSRAARP
jgi:hypothetical protein